MLLLVFSAQSVMLSISDIELGQHNAMDFAIIIFCGLGVCIAALKIFKTID